jgi:hypothetical protein
MEDELNLMDELNRMESQSKFEFDDDEDVKNVEQITARISSLNDPDYFTDNKNNSVKEEKQKPASERDTALEDDLLGDISTNLEKINHHGKRASDIVKSMLQHSRSSSGVKEPTDPVTDTPLRATAIDSLSFPAKPEAWTPFNSMLKPLAIELTALVADTPVNAAEFSSTTLPAAPVA